MRALMNCVSGGEESSGVNYSLEEQVIGTWIDGRPLYQKVVTGTVTSIGTWKNINHGIDNIDYCQSFGILQYTSNNVVTNLCLGGYAANNHYSSLEVGPTSVGIMIANNGAFSGASLYIILQYTKTTD